MDIEDKFSSFLQNERKRANITLERLGEGLYTPGMMKRIESGERRADKMMQDRLLGRLGIQSDVYENYLSVSEYNRWIRRQKIVREIEIGEQGRAAELLQEYEECPPKSVVEQQFCIVMRAQLLALGKREKSRLADLYREAVLCTIPNIEQKELMQLQLSIQELNLIMEYAKYCKGDHLEEEYDKILAYIDESGLDDISKAKIYPKAVYYKS